MLNKNKLGKLGNCKYQFSRKTFLNENLTRINESISFNCRRFKCNSLFRATYTRDCNFHLKHSDLSRLFKIVHMEKLYEIFPDFVLDEDEDLFHNASQYSDSTTQSSY